MLCFSSKKSALWACQSRNNSSKNWLTCVARIEFHWLKSFIFPEWRASPFPDTTHLGLTRKGVSIASYCNRVPIFEANICIVQVAESILDLSALLRQTGSSIDAISVIVI